jgi:hypothetical protein
MRVVEIGHNRESKLSNKWDKDEYSRIDAYTVDFLDLVACKIQEDEYNYLITLLKPANNPDGVVDVRQVEEDYYLNGYHVMYANKKRNELCKKIEEFLNTDKVKTRLKEERVLDILKGNGFDVKKSRLPLNYPLVDDENFYSEPVTEIEETVFEDLFNSKRYKYGVSTYSMTKEIEGLKQELDSLKNPKVMGDSSRHH